MGTLFVYPHGEIRIGPLEILTFNNILKNTTKAKETGLFTIVTIIKRYIHSRVIQGAHLALSQAWDQIKWYRDTERKVYTKHYKENVFNDKWKLLKSIK